MKIAVLGPAHPLRGGIASTNEVFARSLQKAGHEVCIFSFSYQYPGFLFPGKTQYSEEEAPDDLTIESTISSVNPLTWRKTIQKVKAFNPDVVFIRYWLPFMAPALGTLGRALRKTTTVIGITDNVIPHEKRPGDAAFTKYFISACHGFITLSSTVKAELESLTSKPCIYLPHPVNEQFGEKISKAKARNTLNLDSDTEYVLFFGLVRAYKGLDLLLKAFGTERIKRRNTKLLIIGEFYDDPEKYLNMIKELNLEGRIVFENRFIPQSNVKDYFCAADLVAQTYHTASQSGITQIAYWFDAPMLVTDVGGLKEFVPHNKVGYVAPKNPEKIAAYIEQFFEQSKFDEFSSAAAVEKKKYLWSTFVEKAVEFSKYLKSI